MTSYTPTSILCASGRYIDLFDPNPDAVHLRDLTKGLDQPRFRAQTTQPVSVADHLCRAARFALVDGQPLEVVVACLLHDAAEAYLGDPPGPIKQYIRLVLPDQSVVAWSELELRWLDAICTKLLPEQLRDLVLPLLHEDDGPVHHYDRLSLEVEALLWLPGSDAWAGERLCSSATARYLSEAVTYGGWSSAVGCAASGFEDRSWDGETTDPWERTLGRLRQHMLAQLPQTVDLRSVTVVRFGGQP